MAAQTLHVCARCGFESRRWHGRCPGCGSWNTLVEQRAPTQRSGGGSAPGRARPLVPRRLADIAADSGARIATGIGELDRVLGGGFVPGSLVLIGGEPGVGKSTLTTMAAAALAAAGERVLYVSGEESAGQVRLRAERLGRAALEVPVVCETDVGAICATIERERPALCVVDSVQVLRDPELASAPGSVAQVRETAARLLEAAKRLRVCVLLVGHVTKDGAIAGPRTLEHLVDCVLAFEGERERGLRVLRAFKNRFGATGEAGLFEMADDGLAEVGDASARLVGSGPPPPGSVVLSALEGSRPLLCEVQALVVPSEAVPPRRVSAGVDRNRLALVLAVLQRFAGLRLGGADVFVSIAGGLRVDEPGGDLAVALAVASAARGVPLGDRERRVVAFGEVGLGGELRPVAHAERRHAEAARFGLAPVIAPGGETPTLRAALQRAFSVAAQRVGVAGSVRSAMSEIQGSAPAEQAA